MPIFLIFVAKCLTHMAHHYRLLAYFAAVFFVGTAKVLVKL